MKSRISTTVLCFIFVSVAKTQQWSTCTKTCGGGTKSMEYCLWGNICSTIYRQCGTEPCITGDWGEAQPCSKTCGGGTTFRVRWCRYNKPELCPKYYEDCNTKPCNELDDCPRGYRFRYEDDSSCCKIVNGGDCGVDVASSRRIVGGENATEGDWPWVVALVKAKIDVIHCGASLLNERWVVTAAHCLEYNYPKEQISLYVLLGSVTIKNPVLGFQKRFIEENITHPDYKYPKNDIGLVKMDEDVTFTKNIRPICLPTGEITPTDKTCVVVGWGRTIWHVESSFKNYLQQVRVRTLPLDACIQGYKHLLIDDDIWRFVDKLQHICAGILAGRKDSCKGDSGGPLMCQRCSTCGWYLAGLVSFGPSRCGDVGLPAGYMNVYNYQYWIRQYVTISSKDYFVC